METCNIREVSKAQIFGIIGALLLIFGCFLPLFSVTVLGKTLSISFLTLGFDLVGFALIVIALVIVGLFGTKKIQEAQGAGAAVFVLILVIFMEALLVYNGIKFAGGPIIDLALSVFSFGYAWVVLFAGALLVILAPLAGSLCKTKE
jgi:amino acid transporter